MKASYNEQPQALELMPDGYSLFRFDIEEVAENEKTSYKCREIKIHGAVTSDKVIAAVIEDKWGGGLEQKLINDYNEFKLGLGDKESETTYLNFLTEKRNLKDYVKEIINNQTTTLTLEQRKQQFINEFNVVINDFTLMTSRCQINYGEDNTALNAVLDVIKDKKNRTLERINALATIEAAMAFKINPLEVAYLKNLYAPFLF